MSGASRFGIASSSAMGQPIVAELGIAIGTVTSRVHRARPQLLQPTDYRWRRPLRALTSLVRRLTSGDLDLDARPPLSRALHVQPASQRFDSISEAGGPRPQAGVGATRSEERRGGKE